MNCRSLGLALVLMYPALGVRAEPLPDLIDRMKPSVVLLGSHGSSPFRCGERTCNGN